MIQPLSKVILLFCLALAVCATVRPQKIADTLFLSSRQAPRQLWKRTGEQFHPEYTLENKTIYARNNVSSLLDKLVYADIGFNKRIRGCNLPVDGPLVLNGCSLTVKDDTSDTDLSAIDCGRGNTLGFKYTGTVTINNCHFPKDYSVSLPASIGNSFMTADTLGSFSCVLAKRSLIIANNYLYGNIYVDHSDVSDYVITLAGTHFMNDSANQVSVNNSLINAFLLIDSYGKNILADFFHDTLNGAVSIRNNNRVSTLVKRSDRLTVTFDKCIINCAFVADYQAQQSKIIFKDCSFGPDANLSSLGFDSIVFNNCFNIPNPLLLTPDTSLVQSSLSFLNSNINNIKFDYNGKFSLYFDSVSGANSDLVSSTYENLLAKYKIEGKNESFKNIDIEYTRYRNRLNGAGGWISDKLGMFWWYYGYRKYYILYWSLFFLAIFVMVNFFNWSTIQAVYPVVPIDKPSFFDTIRFRHFNKWRTFFNVFIFTAFIFFSLKVDFNKISYKSSKLLIYFFFQYLVGLACVFFIANAILKLN